MANPISLLGIYLLFAYLIAQDSLLDFSLFLKRTISNFEAHLNFKSRIAAQYWKAKRLNMDDDYLFFP